MLITYLALALFWKEILGSQPSLRRRLQTVNATAEQEEITIVHRRFHEKVRHQEKLAELYYDNQKKERDFKNEVNSGALRVGANFPCLYGANTIGMNTAISIIDGHKYSCGINVIKGTPIVYSFGSDQRQDFEVSLLDLRPDAKVFVFELDPALMVPPNIRLDIVSYNNYGLGYPHSVQRNDAGFFENSPNLRNLTALMKMNGHRYIDLIKIDIEGGEWDFIEKEGHLLKRVGQLLIEVHTNIDEKVFSEKAKTMIEFIEKLEAYDLRVFHKEPNLSNPVGIKCCSEFSLIQRDWYAWNHAKFNLEPLP
jgi:hypothetical protein